MKLVEEYGPERRHGGHCRGSHLPACITLWLPCRTSLQHCLHSTLGASGKLASLYKSRYKIDSGNGNLIYLQTKLGTRYRYLFRFLRVFTSKAFFIRLHAHSSPVAHPRENQLVSGQSWPDPRLCLDVNWHAYRQVTYPT